MEFHLSSDTVIFGVWWKSSTQLQPEFDEVEFHFSSSTVIFGVWWKSSTQLQPDFDEVEFHCRNSIEKFGGVEFQLQFNITEFVRTLSGMFPPAPVAGRTGHFLELHHVTQAGRGYI